MSYLQFKKVKKEYNRGNEVVEALSSISFEVEKGEFTVILGPSGSGKSTLLNLLGGMDVATKGEIILDDMAITDFSVNQLSEYRRSDVGFVFQFYNLIPSLNVFENVDMAARLGRNPLNSEQVLLSVGLEKRHKHFPAELSGGEAQRTAIARAICKNPKILLCDEPTGALDSETGVRILGVLHDMVHIHNKTVIVVTHNASIAEIADRVIRIKDGRVISVVQNITPKKIDEVIW